MNDYYTKPVKGNGNLYPSCSPADEIHLAHESWTIEHRPRRERGIMIKDWIFGLTRFRGKMLAAAASKFLPATGFGVGSDCFGR